MTIVVLGTSITAGHRMCCPHVKPWPAFLEAWLQHTFALSNGSHRVINKAKGGYDTVSQDVVWPYQPGADLVILESAANDAVALTKDGLDTGAPAKYKASLEKIILRVKGDKSSSSIGPAFIDFSLVASGHYENANYISGQNLENTKQVAKWMQDGAVGAQHLLHREVARYHGFTQLAISDALLPELRTARDDNSSEWWTEVWGDQCCFPWCYDASHVNEEGHARFAQFISTFILQRLCRLDAPLALPEVFDEAVVPAFAPLTEVHVDQQPSTLLSFRDTNGSDAILSAHGWYWYPDVMAKAGWISLPQQGNDTISQTDRVLRVLFKTGPSGLLEVGYLKSYDTRMGIARMELICDHNTSHSRGVVNAHDQQQQQQIRAKTMPQVVQLDSRHDQHISITFIERVEHVASPGARCSASFFMAANGPPKFKLEVLRST